MAPTNGFSKILVFLSKNQNFIKIVKMEMLLKPLAGARFVANKVTTTKDPAGTYKVFQQWEQDSCQNLHRTRTREGYAGTRGSTIIFF